MKFDEKRTAERSLKSFKIETVGAQGLDFSDLGKVSIFDVTFYRISLFLWTNHDPTGTHRGFGASRGVICEQVRAAPLVGILNIRHLDNMSI